MTRKFSSVLLGTTVALAATLAAWSASATTIVALSGPRTLQRINVETGKVVGTTRVVGGVGSLLAIDVRPADRRLYGLLRSGRIVVINPVTGVTTFGKLLDFDFSEGFYSIDFNPTVDRLRIVGNNGTNLRANLADGMITVDTRISGPETNPFGDRNESVIAAAYTNSFAAAKATQLYDIDVKPAALYLQTPPNDGKLSPVGLLGMNVGALGFDISTDSSGRNRGWIVTNNRLHEIDLAGGAVVSTKLVKGLSALVRDIAVLPLPPS